MNSFAAVKLLQKIQKAFKIIALLKVIAYMWPEQAQVKDGDIFDFIVVGAGTAGCVVATRLAEDNKTKVLLIEAGGDPPLETTIPGLMIYLEKDYLDWNYKTENDGYTQQCHQGGVADLLLGKMLGGSGGLNFLLFSEGHYRDYNNWAKIVNDKIWSWKNVENYFFKAFKADKPPISTNLTDELAKYYGTKGVLGLTKDTGDDVNVYLTSFQECGNKLVPFLNGNNTLGYTASVYTIASGVRQNSANYLTPIKDYPNLYVLTNAVAKRILFDNKKNAVGVEIVTEDGKTIQVKSRKEIIISGGVVNSPKLLMLSGIGPRQHLKSLGINVISNLPVGENFQDHIATVIIQNMTNLPGSKNTRDSRNYPANVISGFVNLDKTKDYPIYSTVNYINYAQYLIQFCRVTYGLFCKICDALFANSNTNQMVFTVVTNLRPKSRGVILLRSANYSDAPIVRSGYYSHKEDLENEVEFIKDFLRITNTSSFKKGGGVILDPKLPRCAKYEFGSTNYWRCYALCMMITRRHYAGTNAMGSVVDSRLRVKGVKKLRVADASIMPVIISGDTYAATVVIGEKAADIIKEDNKNIFP